MTNEELALNILANNKVLRTQIPTVRGEIRDALIELANKKDQQFKEYLEKKKAEIPLSYLSDWKSYENAIYRGIINDIINELSNKD